MVLPFEDFSPDSDNAFFADGLTKELIPDLSKVKALKDALGLRGAYIAGVSHKI